MKAIGTIAALSASVAATITGDLEQIYTKYVAQHNKNYLTTEEYEVRFENFAKTHYAIERHNAQNKSWTLGHNFLSDWTETEKKLLNGFTGKPSNETPVTRGETIKDTKIDWTHLSAVSNVKNQGHCGSCWAFSTTGSIESNTEIKHGNYIPISEQQLVDCSTLNNGCNGGEYDPAFKYAADHGMNSEEQYPYQGIDGKCRFDAYDVVNYFVNIPQPYTDISAGDIDTFLTLLAKGPISIALQADQHVFHNYTGGVIADDGTCGTNLDHAVLAVGHGTENGVNYVLVKNSWGPAWGVGGFVKLSYGAGKSSNGGVTSACGFLMQTSQVNIN